MKLKFRNIDINVSLAEDRGHAAPRRHFRADHELFSENVPIFEFTAWINDLAGTFCDFIASYIIYVPL